MLLFIWNFRNGTNYSQKTGQWLLRPRMQRDTRNPFEGGGYGL